MFIDQVKTGDRVDISTARMAPIDWRKAYSSRVEAVLENRVVLVQAPIHMGALVRLTVDDLCTICFVTDRGKMLFNARVVEYIDDGGVKILSLRLVGNGEKMQLRDFFRFNCTIPISYFTLNENGEPVEITPNEGIIRDIGGGGMRMLSRYFFEPNILIRSMIQLNKESILAFGNVLYRDMLETGSYPYQYRVRFAAMSTFDQDKIIQFIYNEQRRNQLRPK